MISNKVEFSGKTGVYRWLKPVTSVFCLGIFTYTLFLQIFVGFVNFGVRDEVSGRGASFDEVLTYQISEGRVGKNSTIFSVRQNDVVAYVSIGEKMPKFLAFDLNYLSTDDVRLKISFQSNSLEVAQDYLTIVQGIQHYKIPKIDNFDTILVTSQNQVLTKLGVNGISTLTQLGLNKFGVNVSVLIMFLYLTILYWKRFKVPKYLQESLQELKQNFKAFVGVNLYGLFGLMFSALSGYGFFVTNFTLSIDEELFWMIKDGAPWVGYGRFGNYFLDKYLTIDSSVVPYFTDFFAVVLLLFSAIIFLFSWARERSELKLQTTQFIIAGGLFLTFPFVNADFMAFSIYNLWLSLGYVLTGISVILTRSYHKKFYSFNSFVIVILMTTAISIYQSFISVYLIIVAILELRKVLGNENRTFLSQWIPPAFFLVTSTCLYYALNFIAQKKISAGYGYIGMLVGWNEQTHPFVTLRATLDSILNIYLGKYGTSGRILTILTALFLCRIVIESFGSRSLITAFRIYFSSLLVIFAPFSIALILGNMLPARSLVGLPLFLSGAWLIITTNSKENYIKNGLATIGFILLIFQLQYLNMVFYGDHLRYQNDLHLGRNIVQQIEVEGFDYKVFPIVFIGERDIDATKLISKINSGGRSFFDDSSQSYRMTYFLRTIGYSVLLPTSEDIQIANSNPPIPSWPQSGSVTFDGSVISVRLSK
jgi:hypothetical protein